MNCRIRLWLSNGLLGLAAIHCEHSASSDDPVEEVTKVSEPVLVAAPAKSQSSPGAKVAMGYDFACAVVGNNSALKCWGSNTKSATVFDDGVIRGDQPGEMGDALPLVDLTPYEVPNINEVSIGGNTVCITRAGADGNYIAQCWGNNGNGQLGLGDLQNRNAPVKTPAIPLPGYRVSVGGFHVCRMPGNDVDGPNGSVYCLGFNGYGQLGAGVWENRGEQPSHLGAGEIPVNLGTGRKAKSIAAGQYHTCALLDNNQVKCWGMNYQGQLGLGDTMHRGRAPIDMGDNLPTVPLGTGRYAKAISAGYYISCALLDNDVVKCWGDGRWLGNGTTAFFGDNPNELGDNPAWKGVYVGGARGLSSGLSHSCAFTPASVTCWGANDNGELGLGDRATRGEEQADFFTDRPNVLLNSGMTDVGTLYGAPAVVESVIGGGGATCAQLSGGSTYRRIKCWGRNVKGQLGLGDTNNRGDAPNEMGNNLPKVDLGSRSVAWLEDGSDPRQDSPIAAGIGHTCAILNTAPNQESGPLKCWGYNYDGELGLGDSNNRGDADGEMSDNLPIVDLGPGRTVKRIAAGWYHTCAILDDDTLRCWGSNSTGELGLGDKISRGGGAGTKVSNLPAVQLGTGRKPVKITAGLGFTCALLDNATVKCWGGNLSGTLGRGNTTDWGAAPGQMGDNLATIDFGTSAPVVDIKAGALHVCALFSQSAAYSFKCWGLNEAGQLGLGDTNSRGDQPGEVAAIPLQPAGDLIAVGSEHTCTGQSGPNGFIKCWGYNGDGELGLGDLQSRGGAQTVVNLPALPGLGMSVQKLWAGPAGQRTCASGTDTETDYSNARYRVKCWGSNNLGVLGLGDTANRGANPNEVGSTVLPYVDLGLNRAIGVSSMALGLLHTCAVVQATGQVKCWGSNYAGQLGLGADLNVRGDATGEMGNALPFTPLGSEALESTDTYPPLDDNNPCTTDTRNPTTYAVTHTNITDNTTCNDGTACTTGDKCLSGVCTGTGIPLATLDDGNPCTTDSCDPVKGVQHVASPIGMSCSDNNACTTNDTCSGAGVCVGVPVAIPAPGPCSYSICNSTTGAISTANAPSGTGCNADNSLCTQTVANPANAIMNDACNGSGVCVAGTAVTVPDDGKVCTADTCDPTTGYPVHTPLPKGAQPANCGTPNECDGAGRCGPPIGTVMSLPAAAALPVVGEGTVSDRVASLYTGTDAIQKKPAGDTTPFTFDLKRVGVLQGRVLGNDSLPLAKVRITIKDHPEYGYTESRVDGKFDIAVEGGGTLNVNFDRDSYLSSQRTVRLDWNKAKVLEDVVLLKPNLSAEPPTSVPLCTGGCNVTAPMTIQIGGVTASTAPAGKRGAVLLFPASAQAQVSSSTQTPGPVSTLSVASSEYTRDISTGEGTALPLRDARSSGSLAMPGELPPASAYTFAVDLFDSNLLSDATANVTFTGNALPIMYVDNFVGFPVGATVPVGSYDKTKAAWKPEASGTVVKILAIDVAHETVTIDTNGDGVADTPGDVTSDELNALYRLTTSQYNSRFKVNDTLWRVKIAHFSPWDCNWPYGPQSCNEGGPCADDDPGSVRNRDAAEDKPNCKPGSTIMCESRVLGESIPVAGTSWDLVYSSERVPGYKAPLEVEITPPGKNHTKSPARWMSASTYAGTSYFEHAFNGTVYVPTPKDRFGRAINGTVRARTELVEHYPAVYNPTNTFGLPANGPSYTVAADRARGEVRVVRTFEYPVVSFDARNAGLGGWDLSIHHWLDKEGGWIFRGDGTRQRVTPLKYMLERSILGTYDNSVNSPTPPDGSNWSKLRLADAGTPRSMVAAPNGDLYVTSGFDRIYQISWDKIRIPCTDPNDAGPCIKWIGYNGNSNVPVAPEDGSPVAALNSRVGAGPARQFILAPDGSIFAIYRWGVFQFYQPLSTDITKVDPAKQKSPTASDPWMVRKIAGTTTQEPNQYAPAIQGIGGPAVASNPIGQPTGVAVGSDGVVYILTWGAFPGVSSVVYVLLKVDTDGILRTVVGGGAVPATNLGISQPLEAYQLQGIPGVTTSPIALAIAPNGDLFFGQQNLYVLRKNGRVEQLTAAQSNGGAPEGGLSTVGYTLNGAMAGVATTSDGSVLFGDNLLRGLRRIDSSGVITTVSGIASGAAGQIATPAVGAPAVPARNAQCFDGAPWVIAPAPNGDIFLYCSDAIFRVFRPGGSVGATDCPIGVPSTDGQELYCFDEFGRHRDTRDARTCVNKDASTCVKKYSFTYDGPTSGSLASVTDAAGNVTSFTRTSNQVQIAPPVGNPTTLAIDSTTSFLTSVNDPAGRSWTVAMSSDGLLQRLQDPRGTYRHEFTYDNRGKLNTDGLVNLNSATSAGTQTLSVVDGMDNQVLKDSNGVPVSPTTYATKVQHTSAEQVPTSYEVRRDDSGKVVRTSTLPTGLTRTVTENPDGNVTTSEPDKVTTSSIASVDPLFGPNVPLRTVTTTFPSGRKVDSKRTHTLGATTDTSTVAFGPTGGSLRSAIRTWTSTTRTLDSISPAGRKATVVLDSLGRVTSAQEAGFAAASYYYDDLASPKGVLWQIVARNANTQFGYETSGNAKGYLRSVTTPLSTTTFDSRNALGFPASQTTVGAGLSLTTGYGWDELGNMTRVTPPGQSAHQQSFSGYSQLASYTAPAMSTVYSNQTTFGYDRDHGLALVNRPGRAAISYVNAHGRLDYVLIGALGQSGSQAIDIEYNGASDASPGHVKSIAGPGPYTTSGSPATVAITGSGASVEKLSYAYDGSLPLSETYAGPVGGKVERTYDNYLNVDSQTVTAGSVTSRVTYGTDSDGAVTTTSISGVSSGLSTNYDAARNLRLTSATVGNTTSALTYDAYGTLSTLAYSSGTSNLFAANYDTPLGGTADAAVTRDALGRLWKTKETRSDGVVHTHVYGYDAAGRLTTVTLDGSVVESYSYDGNGNRTDVLAGSAGTTYDAQDRLNYYSQYVDGSTKYWSMSYKDDGALSTLTDLGTGQVTRYTYDELGNLVGVQLPDGTTIDYIIDGRGRRVGKKRNGTLVKTWLYDGQLRIAAEYDVANNVVNRFVYGTTANIPDYMVKYTGTSVTNVYRIVADHLGTPRVVVDVSTPTNPTKLLEARYSAFGIPTVVTGNLAAVPFGFAGGLYDADTGLVRFGARDYDARFGRWTHKDPILFGGRQTNLYVYVGNDPVNLVDPDGTMFRLAFRAYKGIILSRRVGMRGALRALATGEGVWTAEAREAAQLAQKQSTQCGGGGEFVVHEAKTAKNGAQTVRHAHGLDKEGNKLPGHIWFGDLTALMAAILDVDQDGEFTAFDVMELGNPILWESAIDTNNRLFGYNLRI